MPSLPTARLARQGQRDMPPPPAVPGAAAAPTQVPRAPRPPGIGPLLPRGPAGQQRGGAVVQRVPCAAAWFRLDAIHTQERSGVPDFFNGLAPSKTPAMYKAYRDFIVKKCGRSAGAPLRPPKPTLLACLCARRLS